jgi:sigma-54 dependent transcriptional regulator, acetoin dehydrogenase operon transcriptional activator AcoR
MLQARTGPEALRSSLHLTCAVLAALLGDAHESEVALLRARGEGTGDLDFLIETAWAFVFVETGHPARAAAHLARARESRAGREDPADAPILLLLQAQAWLGERGVAAARAVAAEGQRSVPAGEEQCALRTYASIVCASLALEGGDHDAAERHLAIAAEMRSGILAARADVLRGRLCFARTGDAVSSALDLDRAINRFTVIGALRDLALAYLERAQQAVLDPGGSPGRWLARAQALLAEVGGPIDLQLLRRAWASLEQHLPERENPEATVVGKLRERRHALKGAVDRQCPPCLEVAPCEINTELEGALGTLSQAEEHLSAALEHAIVDRTRMGQLAAATHELASIDEYGELLGAVPRLALVVCPGTGTQLVRLRVDGSLETLGSSGAGLARRGAALEERVREAFQAGGPQSRERAVADSFAVVRLGPEKGRLALVLERDAPSASIGERDLEQLAVYASFAAVSILRASSRAALHEAAARDAATLAAIQDGILVVDPGGTIRSLNQSAAAALGMQRENAVGRKLRDLPGLSPLGFALASAPGAVEVVPLPRGEMVVRAHAYEGGIVAILRDLATEHTIAKRVVGSMARFTFERLVGEDPAFLETIATARRAAASDLPILITGESGTGKELLAQAIHNASGRAAAPFLGINVTAIPRDLVESELFGYEGGTFTGARASGRAGKFELAGRGTLLLDEIGDMPAEIQGKLLRVLQERVVQRLGSVADVQVRARVIATTHRDLGQAVALGHFRLDLYHRLRVVHLEIPPLRARKGDILRIAERQLRAYAERTRHAVLQLSPAVAAALEAYQWPGNVRELVNVVESEASLLPPGEKVISQIPQALLQAAAARPAEQRAPGDAGILSLDEVERRACGDALQRCSGNVARAAQALGVAKNTLYSKMKRWNLGGPEGAPAAAAVKLGPATR